MPTQEHLPQPTAGDRISQLAFFELVEPSDKDYSQAIALYDCIPKYVGYGRVKSFDESNVSIRREFRINKTDFQLKITGAIIERPVKSGSSETKQCIVYPGTREELVEDVLRKIAVSKGRTSYDAQGGFCSFSLYELRQELKATGHTFSFSEIKEALLILHKTGIEISTAEGEHVTSGYMLPSLSLVSAKKLREKTDNTKCTVRFHEIVSMSIQHLDFRQINYSLTMSFKSVLARRLFKRISGRWTGASMSHDYGPVFLNTLFRDTGESIDDTHANKKRKLTAALKELKEKGVIRDYITQAIKHGPGDHDVKITLMASNRYRDFPGKGFVTDTKRANHFEKKQKTARDEPATVV